jgi:hypothetical protein
MVVFFVVAVAVIGTVNTDACEAQFPHSQREKTTTTKTVYTEDTLHQSRVLEETIVVVTAHINPSLPQL